MKESKKGTYINNKLLPPTTPSHTYTHTHTNTHTVAVAVAVFTISSSIYFMSTFFLLFHIVDGWNLFVFFLVKLCSFAILKAFLTIGIFCIKPPAKPPVIPWQKDDLLWIGSVTANLIWEFSNVPMLFFIYIVLLLLYFQQDFTWFLKIFSSVFLKWETVWSFYWVTCSYDSKSTFV